MYAPLTMHLHVNNYCVDAPSFLSTFLDRPNFLPHFLSSMFYQTFEKLNSPMMLLFSLLTYRTYFLKKLTIRNLEFNVQVNVALACSGHCSALFTFMYFPYQFFGLY